MTPAPIRLHETSTGEWPALLEGVLTEPRRLRMALQPVVDIESGSIAGFEALARFAGPPDLAPDFWFAAALYEGRGAELEALAAATALAELERIPEDRWLAVNVSPEMLGSPEVRAALLEPGDLSRVVLELSHPVAREDVETLMEDLHAYREAGAVIAIDDLGVGEEGSGFIVSLRPRYVKLDRALVSQIARDEGKALAVNALGRVTQEIGARLIAEGLERRAELDVLVTLDVPLAQGYLLGKPSFSPVEAPPK